MVPWTLLYEVSEARTLMALWSLTADFAITIAYYGILLALVFAAYLSADAARPRRAVIVEGPGYRRAFIVINKVEKEKDITNK